MGGVVTGLNHVGITVASMEDALTFWTDVLGLSAQRLGRIGGSFLEHVTGLRGTQLQAALVIGQGFTVELLEYERPLSSRILQPAPNDLGATHIAISVTSISGIVQEARNHGWHSLGDPQVIPDGPLAGTLLVYLTNSEGVLLELMEAPG